MRGGQQRVKGSLLLPPLRFFLLTSVVDFPGVAFAGVRRTHALAWHRRIITKRVHRLTLSITDCVSALFAPMATNPMPPN